MSKELTIVPPEGYEIDRENSTLEKIVFKEVKKKITYNTVLSYLMPKMSYAKIAVVKKQYESLVALSMLYDVASYLNDGWVPTWDGKERKYFVCFTSLRNITVDSHILFNEGSIFFKSEELAKQAIDILGEETIRKALTLNH